MKKPGVAAQTGGVVTVRVGLGAYSVHKALLTEHSEYFSKALNGQWKESEEGVVVLKDVERDTFNIFIDWLYMQKLPQDAECTLSAGTGKTHGSAFLAKFKAFVFGDRLLAAGFRLACHHNIVHSLCEYGTVSDYDSIVYAFANIAADSPLLELLVEVHCRHVIDKIHADANNGDAPLQQLPQEFLVRVMLRLSRMRDAQWKPVKMKECDYHGHGTEAESACHQEQANPAELQIDMHELYETSRRLQSFLRRRHFENFPYEVARGLQELRVALMKNE